MQRECGRKVEVKLARSGSPDTIAGRAAEWAVMVEYGEMTSDDRAELDIWLAADRRHRGAFLRARAGLYVAEDQVIQTQSLFAATNALVPDNDNRDAQGEFVPAPLRRGFFRWNGKAVAGGIVLAASVATLMAIDVPIRSLFRQTELASAEQIVALKDGSIATLGKGARIAITLTPDYRRITLIGGEATFEVAYDKARPFVVQSGDVFAQATGTVYSVNRVDETGGTVKVTEGSVLVWARDERDQAVLLHAGGELTLKPGPRLPEASTTAPAPRHLPPPEIAQIAFDNEPIRLAIVRFNRVNSTKIVIADPEIGNIEIVGLFHANDPERFAQAAVALAGGRVEHQNGQIVIKMK